MDRFYSVLLICTLIICTIKGETSFNPQFQVLPLGDSDLLLKWQSATPNKPGAPLYNITVNEVTPQGQNALRNLTVLGKDDHYATRINGLKPDTKYTIYVQPSGEKLEKPQRFTLEARTNKAIKGPPAKPDFEYEIIADRKAYPTVKITWLPCGKLNQCGNAIPGVYFEVKYELKGFHSQLTNRVLDDDFVYLRRCLPSSTYTVRVVSVNEKGETESDPKEIVLPTIPNLQIMEVLNGDEVVIPCKIAASSEGPFKWTINSIRNDSSRLKQLSNGTLQIKKAERFDRGQYKCSLANKNTTADEWVTYLDVKDQTVILNAGGMKKFQRKVGHSFKKQCSPLHDSSLSVSVDWLKNGQKINFESNISRIRTGEYNALLIASAAKEDTGNYSCVATTRLDSAKYDFEFNVV